MHRENTDRVDVCPAVVTRRRDRKWTLIRWACRSSTTGSTAATAGEPPQTAAAKIEKVRALAAERGRNVRFGIRLHTITRDTSAAAWAVADELLAELSPEQIAKQTELHAKSAP